MARYLIELPLIEYRMLKYNPSLLASASIFLALKIIPNYVETIITPNTTSDTVVG
jgi:hypothetical protein